MGDAATALDGNPLNEARKGEVPQMAFTMIRKNVDMARNAVQTNALEFEDTFQGRYISSATGNSQGAQIMEPPYLPEVLEQLVQTNNTLQSCIDAVVTNVHSTGHTISLKKPVEDPNAPPNPTVELINGFFNEVYPHTTFRQMRKQIGRDEEVFGMYYIEVIRDLKGTMKMLRRIDPKTMRMVKLPQPMDTTISLWRGSEEVKVKTGVRSRRFVQAIGLKFIYFKEYGSPFLINKKTGELLADTAENRMLLLKNQAMGSEILSRGKIPDILTPYMVPCWVPQIPSIVGSRKAEEYNLDYFDNGGVPPFIIIVQGGVMADKARTDMQNYFSSKPGAKQGVPVFEAYASGGSLDQAGSVRVTVERFGTERQKDSMFETYDARCEDRVRRAWRLPELFTGSTKSMTFATAYASYTTAEAQVFTPLRDDFDEMMNSTIMCELDESGETIFKSRPMSINDVTNQLVGLELMIQQRAISPSELVKEVNEITSLNAKTYHGADDEFDAVGKAILDPANPVQGPTAGVSATAANNHTGKPGTLSAPVRTKKPIPIPHPAGND